MHLTSIHNAFQFASHSPTHTNGSRSRGLKNASPVVGGRLSLTPDTKLS